MWFNGLYGCFCFDNPFIKDKLGQYQNRLEWQNTFSNLMNIATYSFEWSNLPDTCSERFLELALMFGKACIIKHPTDGFLSLYCAPTDMINIYGQYDKIFAISANGKINQQYSVYLEGGYNKNAQAVMCRDNNLMYPYASYIIMATERLTSAMRSLDVSAKKLKNPYFITCDESQTKSVQKILQDIDNNKDSIITSKSTIPDMFKVFPTQMDVTTVKVLWEHYNNLDNQIRTILGIDNNSQSSKRERLVVDELNANNQYTNINLNMRLKERQNFCEHCNELWDLDMSVKIRDGFSDKGGENIDENNSNDLQRLDNPKGGELDLDRDKSNE